MGFVCGDVGAGLSDWHVAGRSGNAQGRREWLEKICKHEAQRETEDQDGAQCRLGPFPGYSNPAAFSIYVCDHDSRCITSSTQEIIGNSFPGSAGQIQSGSAVGNLFRPDIFTVHELRDRRVFGLCLHCCRGGGEFFLATEMVAALKYLTAVN